MSERYQAVVIGSGFGGAITACRLSKRWPQKVLVLERGKRYPIGSFPRKPHDMARNFWNLPVEGRSRRGLPGDEEEHGLFDVRNYKHMDVVIGAGLGGGSLIYANVFLEPPDEVFDDRWPQGLTKAALDPYYRVAKEVLGARPVPPADDPRRRILRTELFQKVAKEVGRESRLLDLNVFFGNDFEKPLGIGLQDRNRYGAVQTSCVYCAECDIGCNTHSKNTLDLNYLFVAEKRYGAQVLTEHQAESIVPLDGQGRPDPSADGSHGYEVTYLELTGSSRREHKATTERVVLSAGTLGSCELLMRCRQIHKTLPALGDKLGLNFSGNGDFLSTVIGTEQPADPNYGPVITQRIDFDLFQGFNRDRAFILEDASYPNLLAWFVEGIKPGYLRLGAFWNTIVAALRRTFAGKQTGRVGYALSELLKGDISYNTGVLLCMGLDRSDGVMSLDSNGRIELDWPYRNSLPLYEGILDAGKTFRDTAGAKFYLPLPTWTWPWRNNITVHPLGGCILADAPSQGVTSADRESFGQVFGYKGLYVADGSLVPTAVGANPTATISALSEMVAEGITGQKPDADL